MARYDQKYFLNERGVVQLVLVSFLTFWTFVTLRKSSPLRYQQILMTSALVACFISSPDGSFLMFVLVVTDWVRVINSAPCSGTWNDCWEPFSNDPPHKLNPKCSHRNKERYLYWPIETHIKHMRTALDAVKRVKMLSTKSQLVLVGASFLDRSESAVSKNQMNVTIDYFRNLTETAISSLNYRYHTICIEESTSRACCP